MLSFAREERLVRVPNHVEHLDFLAVLRMWVYLLHMYICMQVILCFINKGPKQDRMESSKTRGLNRIEWNQVKQGA
jgi:hypothetical protein